MHRMVIIIAALLVVGLAQAAVATDASTSADNRKTEKSTGITVDDLGRGLKSAAQNIEKEIPKMGSAIGNAVKKITEKGPERPSSQEPAKQKKPVGSVRVDVSSAP
jgi:peptidoglycan hydrolase CwlO-like protein